MIVDLFLLAACGGVFSVPLYAIIQDAAAPSERSRMIAANNIMNALFMVAGAAAAAALAAAGVCARRRVLHVAAVANLLVALWIVRILPHEVYRAHPALVFLHASIARRCAAWRITGRPAIAWSSLPTISRISTPA